MEKGAVVNLDPNILDDFDLNSLLQGFSDKPIFDLDLDLFSESWVLESEPSLDNFQSSDSSSLVSSSILDALLVEFGSPNSVFLFVNYIEKILMDNDDSDDGEKEVGDFFSGVIVDGFNSKKRHCKEEKEVSAAVAVEEKDDNFLSQKWRRQMRNIEPAMLSRERKKMHVKDLEVKSKCLESKCRRLDYALRCCME